LQPKKAKDKDSDEEGHEKVIEVATYPRSDEAAAAKFRDMDKAQTGLDWFGFETRIRQLVADILTNPMEKVKTLEGQHSLMDSEFNVQKRRTDEHEYFLFKYQRRADYEAQLNAELSR